MKKEKEVKNENELSTNEINKKSIRKLRKVLSTAEIFLIAIPVALIGMVLLMGLFSAIAGEGAEYTQEINEMINIEKEGMATSSFIICLSYILYIKILDYIVKIFKNIENEDSPFTEKNLEVLKRIKKFILFSFITRLLGSEIGMGLFAVVIVYAFVLIFEYGCKIQNEVDEIL